MRAFSVTLLVVFSLSSAALSAPKTLADFTPPTLNGLAIMKQPKEMAPPPPDVAATYLDRKSRKTININLFKVLSLKTSKAQFHGLAAGATKDSPAAHLSFKGFEVKGIAGERTYYTGGSRQSEAILLLGDKLDVRVSVAPTDDEDEAIEVLKQLDVEGLNAYAKTMK